MGFGTLVSTFELRRHLGDGGWVIADCRFDLHDKARGRKEYLAGHIPGAVYTDLEADLSAPHRPGRTGRHPLPGVDEMARTFGSMGITDGVQVIAYDDAGGAMAARLWWMLQYLGHHDAAVLDGGWTAWLDEGHPTRSGEERNEPHTFAARPKNELLVDAERVEAIRTDPSWVLLDARDAERYRGEVEPIDPVAGHIPGARSAPYKENLTEDGRFRPPDELRARFAALAGTTPPERVVTHCGSGVTACHNALAMRHAGLGIPRVYIGSWSDWIVGDRAIEKSV